MLFRLANSIGIFDQKAPARSSQAQLPNQREPSSCHGWSSGLNCAYFLIAFWNLPSGRFPVRSYRYCQFCLRSLFLAVVQHVQGIYQRKQRLVIRERRVHHNTYIQSLSDLCSETTCPPTTYRLANAFGHALSVSRYGSTHRTWFYRHANCCGSLLSWFRNRIGKDISCGHVFAAQSIFRIAVLLGLRICPLLAIITQHSFSKKGVNFAF